MLGAAEVAGDRTVTTRCWQMVERVWNPNEALVAPRLWACSWPRSTEAWEHVAAHRWTGRLSRG